MQPSPLRVLAWMEAFSVTGPAKNLVEFARLARERPRPICVTLVTFRRPSHPVSDAFLRAAADIPCEVLAESGPLDLRVLARMRALAGRVRPQIVETHNNKSHFLMRLSGLPHRFPWVAFHHGYTRTTPRQAAYNLLDRWSLRGAERVVTVTSAFVPELERFGVAASRIRVVPNSIRVGGQTRPIRNRRPGHMPLVLAVGRLSREKALADLIEAVALLRQGSLPCRLVVVGHGPERPRLEQLATGRQVHVTFAGHVDDPGQYYADAEVFVLPSRSEGSPNVLLEAMAAGVPVVATAVGGIPEMATDGQHALLVPPAQPARLADAIARLIRDPGLARELAASAAQRIRLDFTPEARTRRLAEIYEGVEGLRKIPGDPPVGGDVMEATTSY